MSLHALKIFRFRSLSIFVVSLCRCPLTVFHFISFLFISLVFFFFLLPSLIDTHTVAPSLRLVRPIVIVMFHAHCE